ncbi:MAG TPA: SufE family protein [Gemmatimonadales bacterium]|nr:SufE family protein [Gemmatimonadales bacterium]
MPDFAKLIARYKGLDRETRLETLLDWSRKLPELPAELVPLKDQGVGRVHECQTPVFLYLEVTEGKVTIHADVPRESPTVRGFLSLLIKQLNGATPAEVEATPDDLLEQLGLSGDLGMTRTQGLTAILGRIKRSVRDQEGKRG